MKGTKKTIQSSKGFKETDTRRSLYIELPQKVQQELAATFKLLEKVEPNKVRKMVRDIRINNNAFHEYLNEARLTSLKYDDLVAFEERYQKERMMEGTEKKKKKLSLEGAKIGFQEFRRKLRQYQYTDFVNEINYYTASFQRQAIKLDKIGETYVGLSLVRVPFSIIKDLEEDENENGIYAKIDRNLLNKTTLIEAAEQKFKRAVNED